LDVDTVCIAVGLSPMSQLADNAGCEMTYDGAKGGYVPILDADGETSLKGIYCAGDVCGIEEASSAMIQGKIAAAAAAHGLGYMSGDEFVQKTGEYKDSLKKIRAGMFGPDSKGRAGITATDEGYPLSRSLLESGFIAEDETKCFPSFAHGGGTRAVIECTQNIPCDPCQDVCPKGCIKVGENITRLPTLDPQSACTGCGLCVGACSGQAIFLVNDAFEDGCGTVGLPYEFLPLPEKGAAGRAFDRSGREVCAAVVVEVRNSKAMDKTPMLVMKVPKEALGKARFFRPDTGRGA
ncbi:MAG: FAD-dependent oxidoreductase, partial [Gracilibacteraceae bacterium]|jgi:Fe-S-cluster-containing hydrogenase component 2|nr:FAD-dependent oxidoreductase [Gracilibacteraceae bacterium]